MALILLVAYFPTLILSLMALSLVAFLLGGGQ